MCKLYITMLPEGKRKNEVGTLDEYESIEEGRDEIGLGGRWGGGGGRREGRERRKVR